MKVGEFVEQGEAVKELLGVDKLLTLHIFHVESSTPTHNREHLHAQMHKTFW